MTDFQWKAWSATAAANNGAPQLPPGDYTGEIIDAGAKATKAGKPQLWWQIKVIVGVHAGAVEKMTQSLNPDNPNALSAFYGVLGRLGIDASNAPDGTPPEAIAKMAVGRKLTFAFSHRTDTATGRVYADFKSLALIDAPSTNTTAPAVVAPVSALTAAVAPEPVPTIVPAEATVEEQIAALQAKLNNTAVAPAAEGAATVPAKGKLPF